MKFYTINFLEINNGYGKIMYITSPAFLYLNDFRNLICFQIQIEPKVKFPEKRYKINKRF